MPKMKTNRSARKRFRVTKGGKLKRGRPGRRHLLSAKSSKRKRHMRRRPILAEADMPRIKKLLGI